MHSVTHKIKRGDKESAAAWKVPRFQIALQLEQSGRRGRAGAASLVDGDRTLGSVRSEGPIASERLLLAGPCLWGRGPRADLIMDII